MALLKLFREKRISIWPFLAVPAALTAGMAPWQNAARGQPHSQVAALPDVKITYSARAESAESAIDNLSQASGTALSVSKELRDEVLLISVKDAPLDKLMAHLAEVLCGSWTPMDSGYRLDRSLKTQRELEATDVEERIKALEKGLGIYAKCLKVPWGGPGLMDLIKGRATLREQLEGDRESLSETAIDALYEKLGAFEDNGPVPRAVCRCLSDLDLRQIAAIPIGSRVVFSTNPNRMQKPLGRGALNALSMLAKEQLVWGEALKEGSGYSDDDFGEDAMINYVREHAEIKLPRAYPHSPWERTLPFDRAPAKFLITVAREAYEDFSGTFFVLDASGAEILRYEIPSNVFDGHNAVPNADEPSATAGERQAPLSDESKAFELFFRMDASEEKPAVVQAARKLMEKFFTAAKVEPLALTVSDGLLALASESETNVVASLSDDLVGAVSYLCADGKLPLGQLEDAIRADGSSIVRKEDGWTLIRPAHPLIAKAERVDRKYLPIFFKKVVKQGWCSFEDFADYSLHLGCAPDYAFASNLLDEIFDIEQPNADSMWSVYRFYGSLAVTQRMELSAGGTLVYGQLAPAQRSLADLAIFGAESESGAYGGYLSDGTIETDVSQFVDPTEELPNGLLPSGRIQMRDFKHSLVSFVDASNPKEKGFWALDLDGQSQRGRLLNDWNSETLQKRTQALTGYRLDFQRHVDFGMELSPQHFSRHEVREALRPSAGRLIGVQDLPPEAQARVADQWKYIGLIQKSASGKSGGN